MSDVRRKRLESTVTQLRQRMGLHVVVSARDLQTRKQVVPTGFSALDDLLGIGGVPLDAITLLSGQTTSGKLTLAYKILCNAQWAQTDSRHPVAILDLTATADADYLQRCGIDLEALLLVRPVSSKEGILALLDLVRNRETGAVLLDHLGAIRQVRGTWKGFVALLPQLNLFLKNSRCALILLDEPVSSLPFARTDSTHDWIGHHVALHVELQRERWIKDSGELRGYQARARVLRNRWGQVGRATLIAIEFNGTVRARKTW
jgi:hypothetical protein